MASEANVSDLPTFICGVFRRWAAEVPDEVKIDGDLVNLVLTGQLIRLSHPEEIVGHHSIGDPRDEALREIMTDVGRQLRDAAGYNWGWPLAQPA
jgi:hypothetical protein